MRLYNVARLIKLFPLYSSR